MADTNAQAAPESAPAAPLSLDSIIEGAYDKVYAPPAPAEAVPEDATEVPGEPSAAERARDEKGRFAPKDPNSATEQHSEPGTSAKVANPAVPPVADPAAQPQPVDPPVHLSAEHKATFAKLPPDAQKMLVEVEKRREADYTRMTQEHAGFRRAAEPLVQAVQPFWEYLGALGTSLGGVPPAQLVNRLLGTEHTLRNGSPDQKVQVLAQIAGQYGIDPAALAGVQVQPQQQPSAPIDLIQRLNLVEQHQQMMEQQRREAEQQRMVSDIQVFATARDDTGQLKHPHFDRVKGVMVGLLESGQAADVPDAYSKATAPIQEVIDAELQRRSATAEQQRQTADQARQATLDKARRAAPVRATASVPGGSAKAADLDSIISTSMAKLGMA